MTVIAADVLYTGEREIRPGGLRVADGRVETVGASRDQPDPGVLLPGFVDLQCNGACGADLADASTEVFGRVGEALLRSGTTAYCPTLPSAPAETYPRFLDAAAEARGAPGPHIVGVHLEGPFLNAARAGAHDPDLLREPDPDWLETLLDRHPGLVRIVTLAPELAGAHDVIALCVDRGIVVAVGHSDATEEQAAAAIEAGATLWTHLFNAMRPLHHRDVGLIGAALADERIRCSLICDGRHLHPTVAAFFARGLGPRAIAVSDAVAEPSSDPLGGGFRLLDGCVANLVRWGIPLADAARMASRAPADLLGLDQLGRLEPGSPADAVLWRDGEVAGVWLGGEPV